MEQLDQGRHFQLQRVGVASSHLLHFSADWIINSDGLRIDSMQNVETSFWAGFESAAGVYMTGEVFSGDPSYVTPFQKYMDGLLNYPV